VNNSCAPENTLSGLLIGKIMEEKEITKKIYVANDGKEFLSKEECEKYERFVKEILSNVKYFRIDCHPDLTETGLFQHKIFVAVYSSHYCHREIAFEWALRAFDGYLGVSVQGCGFQPQFNVYESNKKDYDECPPTIWGGTSLKNERLFLSPKPIDGFIKNIDYMKEWGFK
jgi:hypothetical protein